METPDVLFTCHLLYRPPDGYRFIATCYDENREMFMEADEKPVGEIVFSEEYGNGTLLAMVNMFGIEATQEFILHLLHTGIKELQKFQASLFINPTPPPDIEPKGFITEEFRSRYIFFTAINLHPLAGHNLCVEIIITAMQLLSVQPFTIKTSFSNN